MCERMVLAGPAVTPGGMASVQIDLAAGDEWVYVERVGRTTQVWSGPKCGRCELEGAVLRRCELHRKVLVVGAQYQLL